MKEGPGTQYSSQSSQRSRGHLASAVSKENFAECCNGSVHPAIHSLFLLHLKRSSDCRFLQVLLRRRSTRHATPGKSSSKIEYSLQRCYKVGATAHANRTSTRPWHTRYTSRKLTWTLYRFTQQVNQQPWLTPGSEAGLIDFQSWALRPIQAMQLANFAKASEALSA